ncbi:MAG: class I SAM-dependent methyltransferase [Endozoicomonadaceae bacterium]|nr:class I SAM-dependent methyltransferase [Endozoicomonadaceae bacterium]
MLIKFVLKIDLLIAILLYPSLIVLKSLRRLGVNKFPFCQKVLLKVGVFPIVDHYYEPLFKTDQLKYPLSNNRVLPGIDWNVEEQLSILSQFNFYDELQVSSTATNELEFCYDNTAFKSGDAEYWYSLIRLKKPTRIIEIGSGHSTLMAIKAIKMNSQLQANYNCEHICIEPYEQLWLEKTGVNVVRCKVEDSDKMMFDELVENDIVFIDSSHIIRPQGDVLFEFLELLPSLNKGVIVHIHDIFSPKDYLEAWVKGDIKFWNEQYLLEAFLTSNKDWKIIGALNFLHHQYYDQLKEKCPYLTPDREPGSFYIQKIH